MPLFFIVFEYLQEKIRTPLQEEDDLQSVVEKARTMIEKGKLNIENK